jgi:hypothetical protein
MHSTSQKRKKEWKKEDWKKFRTVKG